jgi:predicted RNase H-like HicB family nuclease
MRYAIVIEQADGNYSAYAPDVPGWAAAQRGRALSGQRHWLSGA